MNVVRFLKCQEAFDFQQWLLKYFNLGLECDVPIIEALYFAPPVPILNAWRREFYDQCHNLRFERAQRQWSYIVRFQCTLQCIHWGRICEELGTPGSQLVWTSVNLMKLSRDEKITRFLSEMLKPKELFQPWGSFHVVKRDASPERH